MSTYSAAYSTVIDATPDAVYAVFADYDDAHQKILPKPYFTGLTVLEGGQGSGTRFTVGLDVFGTTKSYTMTVSEPKTKRILVETDEAGEIETTFNIAPLNGGQQSKVTISAKIRANPGFMGLMERLTTPAISRRIYKKELGLLAEYLK